MLKRYEGLFLFDSAQMRDWASVDKEVRRLCERIGATLLVCVKFDERKLAYEIRRRKRGLYVLTYFDAPTDRIVDLERDAQLSDVILRLLVLRSDISAEKLAALQAHNAETPLVPAGEGRRHDDDRDHRDHRDRGDRGGRDHHRRREFEPEAGPPAGDMEVGIGVGDEPGSQDRD